MTYRDDRAAHAQRIDDLTAQLAGIRSARSSLATLGDEERAVLAQLEALRRESAPSLEHLRKHLPMIARIEIASPCDVSWDAMEGDAQQRHCGQCKLNVYNVSAMTRSEIESLFACGDQQCVRLYRRADGTVITADCPVGFRRKTRRRLAAAAVISVSAAAAVLGALAAFHREGVVTGRFTNVGSIADNVLHGAPSQPDPPSTPCDPNAHHPQVPSDPDAPRAMMGGARAPMVNDRNEHRHAASPRALFSREF